MNIYQQHHSLSHQHRIYMDVRFGIMNDATHSLVPMGMLAVSSLLIGYEIFCSSPCLGYWGEMTFCVLFMQTPLCLKLRVLCNRYCPSLFLFFRGDPSSCTMWRRGFPCGGFVSYSAFISPPLIIDSISYKLIEIWSAVSSLVHLPWNVAANEKN